MPVVLPVDKGALEPLRLVSFFALALVARRYVPAGPALARWPVVGLAIRCGRHSLHIFSAGVLLAVAGCILGDETGHSILIQTVFSAAGVVILLGFAA